MDPVNLQQSQQQGWAPKVQVSMGTALHTDMTRCADQYSRIQCLHQHPGKHQQHSHNVRAQKTQSQSHFHLTGVEVHYWHTHGSPPSTGTPTSAHFFVLIFCSKTAKYSSSDPRLNLCFSPTARTQFEKMWVSFHWWVQLNLWIMYPPHTESTK